MYHDIRKTGNFNMYNDMSFKYKVQVKYYIYSRR